MAEKKFVVYDGVRFREYTGEEIGSTGHFKLSNNSVKDVTMAGFFLDDQRNIEEFKKDFYNFIKQGPSQNEVFLGYNYILMSDANVNDFVSFNASIALTSKASATTDSLFQSVLDSIPKFGYMHEKYILKQNPKKIIIPMTNKKTGKKFTLNFFSLDNQCIKFDEVEIPQEVIS